MTQAPPPAGHNNPPRHELFAMSLQDVRLEAGNWLDGAEVENQTQADAIGVIMSRARQIKKDADTARKEDKEPHLAAGRAVDAAYKPVIDSADSIVSAAQVPLSVWLRKERERQEAEAAEKARKAEEARQAALAAEREAQAGNLEAMEAARQLAKDADRADRDANRASKAKANVAGEGRVIGLRSRQVAIITDRRALLNHVAKEDPEALTMWLQEYARRALPRQLPGVTIEIEQQVA